MSNCLDPDQDLGPNCFKGYQQMIKVAEQGELRNNKILKCLLQIIVGTLCIE